jgi:hypothetical protein
MLHATEISFGGSVASFLRASMRSAARKTLRKARVFIEALIFDPPVPASRSDAAIAGEISLASAGRT